MAKGIKNVYIHLPFCLKKCHFCAFPIHAIGQNNINNQHNQMLFNNYITSLKKQISLSTINNLNINGNTTNLNLLNKSINHNILAGSQIETIYFGGGTPSLFKPQQVHQLIQLVKQLSLPSSKTPQITIQINPQQIQMIPSFYHAGINRFSIGIQSFNLNQLRQFNRATGSLKQYDFNKLNSNENNVLSRQKSEQYLHKMSQKLQQYLRNKYLINFNIDFILDMNPSQQDQNMIFQFINRIKPPHITVYLLQVIQNTYLQRKIKQLKLLANIKKQKQKQKQIIYNKKYNLNNNYFNNNDINDEQLQFNRLYKGFDSIDQKYINFSNKLKRNYGYSHYQVSNFAKLSQQNMKKQQKTKQQDKYKDIDNRNDGYNNMNDNNKRSKYESKHNKIYWQGDRQYIGYGMGASSLLRQKNINNYYRKYLKIKKINNQNNNNQIINNYNKINKDNKLNNNKLNNNDKLNNSYNLNLNIDKYNNTNNNKLYRITNSKTISKYNKYINQLQSLSLQNNNLFNIKRDKFIIDNNPINNKNDKQQQQQKQQTQQKQQRQRQQYLYKQIFLQIQQQSNPIGILQSYILSSIRTQQGIKFNKIKSIILQQINYHKQQQTNYNNKNNQLAKNHNNINKHQQLLINYYQTLIKSIKLTLFNSLSQLNINHQYYSFIYLHQHQYYHSESSNHQQSQSNHYQSYNHSLQQSNTINKYSSSKSSTFKQPQSIQYILNNNYIIGFKLLSPHGYLIADQIAHQLSTLIQSNLYK